MNEEVKIYLQRQEERLAEMVAYEKKLAEQIALEESKLSPELLKEARDNLRKEETIKSLDRKIADLEGKLGIQSETKERVKEITFYRETEEKKLEEIKAYKEPLLKQKQADEKEAEKARANKTAILQEIAEKIIGANKEIEEIKSQKQDYALSLAKRERELADKSQEVADKEMELAAKSQESLKIKSQYSSLLEETKSEKERLEKANLLTKEKEKELAGKIDTLNSQISEASKTEAESRTKLAEISKEKDFITQESGVLKLEKEATEKTKIELDKRQEEIEKDRKHLFRQQAQLRSAFEVAKKKGIY